MNIDQTINIPSWIFTPELKRLFDVLGEGNALLVGGCVRNALLKAHATDIDIATILMPEDVMDQCKKGGFKTIPTGIKYGTITILINQKSFEVTTLRRDVETDGRYAIIEFSNNWLEDAKRRDFTMNALYMDLKGNVFDPLGQGIADLKNKQVRFVGNPAQRIEEDYLRILRFFRFYAQYGESDPDAQALKACAFAASHIKGLSRERITQEFLKILETDRVADILSVMFQHKILIEMPHKNYDPKILKRLVTAQNKYDVPNILSRLFVLGGNKAGFFEKYLRLSHHQKNFLIKLEMASRKEFFKNQKEVKKAIFHHGNNFMVQGYLLHLAMHGEKADAPLFKILQEWKAPDCPVTGEVLLREGYQTGPELGLELKRRTEEWLEDVI